MEQVHQDKLWVMLQFVHLLMFKQIQTLYFHAVNVIQQITNNIKTKTCLQQQTQTYYITAGLDYTMQSTPFKISTGWNRR
jgi:hypothetical protein